MKKTLFLASVFTLMSFAASAQTAQVVSVPDAGPGCTTCRTVVRQPIYQPQAQAQCTDCVREYVAAPPPVVREKKSACTAEEAAHAITSPLFMVKQNEVSMETIGGYFIFPKKTGGSDARPRQTQWTAAERIYIGLTDYISLHLEGGYNYLKPRDYGDVRGEYYDGIIGLQAKILDRCHFDLIVGADVSMGKNNTKHMNGLTNPADGTYAAVRPFVTLGAKLGKITPYVTLAYINQFKTPSDIDEVEGYDIRPGFYITPNEYFAIDANFIKVQDEDIQWNLGVDVFPYKNVAFGIQGNLVDTDEMYGVSAHVKVVF